VRERLETMVLFLPARDRTGGVFSGRTDWLSAETGRANRPRKGHTRRTVRHAEGARRERAG
jgi:hypothetical protein